VDQELHVGHRVKPRWRRRRRQRGGSARGRNGDERRSRNRVKRGQPDDGTIVVVEARTLYGTRRQYAVRFGVTMNDEGDLAMIARLMHVLLGRDREERDRTREQRGNGSSGNHRQVFYMQGF
jgi:hypothetical protein